MVRFCNVAVIVAALVVVVCAAPAVLVGIVVFLFTFLLLFFMRALTYIPNPKGAKVSRSEALRNSVCGA